MSGLGGMGGMGGMGGLGGSGMHNQEQMRMMQIMQEMQMVDSLRMYNELVERCFGHCVSKFRTRKLDGQEVREHGQQQGCKAAGHRANQVLLSTAA